jgi:uncharacterized protein (DUF58 family)
MSAVTRLLLPLRTRMRGWMRSRQGEDADPVTLNSRRIYILPTSLGIVFAGMLFLMLIGAMNYANNLALALSFLLGSLGLVAMHQCHRNLVGLRLGLASTDPVFAGQRARFRIALLNDAPQPRPELELTDDKLTTAPVRLDAATREPTRAVVEIGVDAERRGKVSLDRFEVSTRYPFGLFRAWAVLHMNLECIVYPRPGDRDRSPPPVETDVGGAQDGPRGDEEFAGLRTFHAGDSPRRIAWKTYARGQGLHTKHYAGTAVISHVFDWDSLEGLGPEARLSQLCRWVIDAHAAGRAYGLKIPGLRIDTNVGDAHRQRCLTALALFQGH